MGGSEALEPTLVGPFGHVVAICLGALFGSFGNVCIYRMPPTDEFPDGRSVALPPSHCPACKTPIAWYDNVPLFSYLWLRGRCRACKAEFSPRYLLVEGATALLFGAAYHFHLVVMAEHGSLGMRLARFGVAAALSFVLVVITFIDLDHKLILDKITYPAIPLLYALGVAVGRPWWHGLVGAAVGYGVIRGVSDGYYLLTGRRGLGYGDGKLLAVVGAWLGWQAVMVALFLGSLIGSVVTIAIIVLRGKEALGPSIAELEAAEQAAEQAAATAAAEPTAGEAPPVGEGSAALETDEPVSIRHVEVPFGPFLAAGALVYMYVEPILRVSFTILYS